MSFVDESSFLLQLLRHSRVLVSLDPLPITHGQKESLS